MFPPTLVSVKRGSPFAEVRVYMFPLPRVSAKRGFLSAEVRFSIPSCGSEDLHVTLEAKAGALCYSLVMKHPFSDGNKRVGHAAAETLLVLNGFELDASVDDAERVILGVAASKVSREALTEWIR